MLVGRSQCTAQRGGDPFLFERRGGLLGHARRGNRTARTLTSYLLSLFFPIRIPCCIRVSSIQRNRMYSLSVTKTRPRAQGVSASNAFVQILSATISLGNVGIIRGFPNCLGILQGELRPSPHIILEVPQVFCRLSKDHRLIWSRYRTYRKSSDTRIVPRASTHVKAICPAVALYFWQGRSTDGRWEPE
jgi:hypothetical protein